MISDPPPATGGPVSPLPGGEAAPARESAPDLQAEASLDRSLASGLAWTGAARWLAQIVSWAATIIVARLLTRTDYGIYGAAAVYIGIVQLINELGLGAALVRDPTLSRDQRAGSSFLAWRWVCSARGP